MLGPHCTSEQHKRYTYIDDRRNTSTHQQITSFGQPVILSAPWYLNYFSYGSDWLDMYTVDPAAFPGAEASKDLLLGGEVKRRKSHGFCSHCSTTITQVHLRRTVEPEIIGTPYHFMHFLS